ncbi:ABC transporter substrate-binding protein [Actinoplanes couchii]|uniref:ABC transporter substrate-binding protein n=1 Tax=Actinoplanes couchii TaxID=403638 RepID=A0ABQ3X5M9_9ACTN|nr:extracellular solute-binding protein [Actinoplanes couchii]MDR6325473.1 cellobiose transport system substrate-binding protein [Actinoplanes couchii]GID53826.1 ABC transporter substrate-binding protein [Actinoplanes couchii]
MEFSGRRVLRVGATGLVAALAITGCSGQALEGNKDSGNGTTQVTLKVNVFGSSGLEELKSKYEAANPNVKIALNSGEYNAQHEDLQKKLVAGSGAADIAMVDEGFIVQFRSQADQFLNLNDKGAAGTFEAKYLPWKWKASQSTDGKQIGLGTDVGGLAMCYRTDLFKAADLPTDRESVGKLWPTWDAFIETGKKYTAKTGKKFVDSATNLFNPVLSQQPAGFYDETETLKMDGGPKAGFDVAMKAIDAGISANLAAFQPNWDQGFKKDQFAALPCPAWMLGHIQETAPDQKGKWDITAIPGGGGNWGGSWWTIPKQTKNADEAYKLVSWLVQPEQQIEIFKTVGNLPSQPELYKDPAVLDYKKEFFTDAPTGQIFAATAANLQPQYLGKKNGPTRVAVENVINRVGQGKLKSADAWAEAVKDAEKVAKSAK